jgi:hypothetical protein
MANQKISIFSAIEGFPVEVGDGKKLGMFSWSFEKMTEMIGESCGDASMNFELMFWFVGRFEKVGRSFGGIL